MELYVTARNGKPVSLAITRKHPLNIRQKRKLREHRFYLDTITPAETQSLTLEADYHSLEGC